MASDIHDNPGAALAIRSGAEARIVHNVFMRNGLATHAAETIVIEAGARPLFSGNVFHGANRNPPGSSGEPWRPAFLRDNWFPRPMSTVFHRIGPYEIDREIGRGGMAVVFLATDTRTDSRVALRLVATGRDQEADGTLEAECWGAKLQEQFCLASPHVPRVYEHGTQDGYLYIAMEYLDGQNLSEVIAGGPMPSPRAIGIGMQLCDFLETAHAFEVTIDGRQLRSLLHGDLQPRNIRILEGDQVKVLDFGIAKALSLSRKVTRNDFGSIAYLSPERLDTGDIDAQADLWAVGVLLYEMVSGTRPFKAADTRRLEQQILARRLADPLGSRLSRRVAGGCRQGAGRRSGRPLRQREGDAGRPDLCRGRNRDRSAAWAMAGARRRRAVDETDAST